jgi:hypothetical protein
MGGAFGFGGGARRKRSTTSDIPDLSYAAPSGYGGHGGGGGGGGGRAESRASFGSISETFRGSNPLAGMAGAGGGGGGERVSVKNERSKVYNWMNH